MSDGNTPPRTLGPVQDLERHLPEDWWRHLFNDLYIKTDADVVEDPRITALEIDRILQLAQLERDDRILDLCCGQGRHLLELARRGFSRLIGVDGSPDLLRLGRARAAFASLDVELHEGDARHLDPALGPVDAVLLLGNSFGYFDHADDDRRVLESVRRLLAPGGTLVLDISDGAWLRANFDARSWEWIDARMLVCRERALSADGTRLVSREVVVDAEEGVIVDQFYAQRPYSADQICALLEDMGFEAVRCETGYETPSARNQDLGMMANRLFITARRPRAALRSTSGAPLRDVTVLLGDPRLPARMKPGGRFGAEDHDTLRRLREALDAIDGYTFTVLDDHRSLLSSLRRAPPDFVFNLCDEGFSNDATMEAHIPALLEMLGVPYSGAGPAGLTRCFDKGVVSAIARQLSIAVPAEIQLEADEPVPLHPPLPALVKPVRGDGSRGIWPESVVHTIEEARAAVARLRQQIPGEPLLLQEYLDGAEFSVGLIGNPGLGVEALPILEYDYSGLPEGLPPILAYASKWDRASPYWTEVRHRRAQVREEVAQFLKDTSLRLFERVGCRDYGRLDFRCDAQGHPRLIEVNPNPGWSRNGKLNRMAELAGWSYADLLRAILEAAQRRVAASGGTPSPRLQGA
ncbi:MAG: methyltransferase domain-containing protein [Alphaproteobacteria bacterium]|nr:methyltransferase domain-containing protein [Alphaproteobacteria bacterium]